MEHSLTQEQKAPASPGKSQGPSQASRFMVGVVPIAGRVDVDGGC